jgi:type IX secretion system PorP/SprF family membrane protein
MKWLLYILIFITLPCFAQDVGFSQFSEQPFLRNPALSGNFEEDMRLSASFRNQWQSVTIPYQTFAASGECKLYTDAENKHYFTLGLQLLRDVAGDTRFSTMQMMPAVNYSVSLSRERRSLFSVALMPGLLQQRFDPSKLQMNDQFIAASNGTFSIAPTTSQVFNNTRVNYFDLAAGIVYNGAFGAEPNETDYYIGASLFHIRQPNVGFFQNHIITMNRKLALNAGLSAPLDKHRFILYGDLFRQFDKQFKPTGSFSMQGGAMVRFVLGDEDDQTYFTLGMLYRLNDAVIPLMQLQLSRFMLGMSYDVNVDKLAAASQYRGGLEVILTYRGFLNRERSWQQQRKCPRF